MLKSPPPTWTITILSIFQHLAFLGKTVAKVKSFDWPTLVQNALSQERPVQCAKNQFMYHPGGPKN